MKSVKRFELSVEPIQRVKIPFNSTILDLGQIDGKPVLFVLVDDSYNSTERTFHTIAVNKEVPQRFNESHFIGYYEFKDDDGIHYLQVFEER